MQHARALDVDGDQRMDLFTSSPAGGLLHTALGQGRFETLAIARAETPLWAGSAAPAFVDAAGELAPAPVSDSDDDGGAPGPEGRRPVLAGNAFDDSRGQLGTSTSGGFSTTTDTVSSPVGELAIAPVGPICADTLMDQETGGCLEASSTPASPNDGRTCSM